jgi:hypothetical protein
VDVGVEALLDDPEQLVPGTKKRDHRLVAGDDEGGGDALRSGLGV